MTSAAAAGAAVLSGCFFELAEVADGFPSVGGGGSAGAAGGGIGGSIAAGDGGGGLGGGQVQPTICPRGQKDCGGGCVPATPANGCNTDSCQPCADLANATTRCNGDTGACQFAECNAGWADCDGDTRQYGGVPGGNGCEYPFGPNGEIREAPALLEAPRAAISIDTQRDDWSGIPAYPLLATCENCQDNAQPPIVAQNEVPSRDDLDAYFRVAWDGDFFYVLADVFDNQLEKNAADSGLGGQCQLGGALCMDAITVFFDGLNDRAAKPNYQGDDSRTYLSLSNVAVKVSGAPVEPQQVGFMSVEHEALCYRIEAALSWRYLVGAQGDTTVIEGILPPAAGQEYGFDLSVNDWDRSVSDPSLTQRDSQLFWVSPGNGYNNLSSGFGPIRLIDPAAAPAQ